MNLADVLERVKQAGYDVVGLRPAQVGEERVVSSSSFAIVRVPSDSTALTTSVLVVRKVKRPIWTIRVLETTPRMLHPGEIGIADLNSPAPHIYSSGICSTYPLYPISITRGEE